MLQSVIQSLKIVTIVLLAVGIILGGQRFFNYYVNKEIPADTGQPVSFTVKQDDDSSTVAARLSDQHLIRSSLAFKTQMRLANTELKPGTYTLRKGMSISDILDVISGNKPVVAAPQAQTKSVTFIEGWRTEQDAEAVAQAGLQGGAQAFMNAVKQVNAKQFSFLSDRPKNASLEGYLFPDTYNFKTDDAGDLVLTMLQNFDQKFTPDMRQRAKAMNMTIYQVLTIASIVEREAEVNSERPIIASVYLNRLQAGMPLQADPTVQYAVGKPGDWWPAHLTDAQLKVDSLYNTYQHDGWPPGPICNPSLASIQAVLNPDNDNYLYFVAKGDGTHAFAATYQEQEANVAKYQGGGGGAAPHSTAPAGSSGAVPSGVAVALASGAGVPPAANDPALTGVTASARTGDAVCIVQIRGSG